MSLSDVLASLPSNPRVVVSGNHAVPFHTLAMVDAALDGYRLWALNAPTGLPEREGVVHETPFVGVGVRRSPRLSYVPCRLSLVPSLFRTTMPPDLVVVHTTRPRAGRVSLGVEVNIEPSGGFSDVARSAGRIGLGLLQRYRVLLDPTAGHLVLGDPSGSVEPPLRSTSGLQMVREGGALRVLHVMRGSPAAFAGWKTGERICAVDGEPVDADSSWPYGAPGRTVMLSLCGAGIRTITLARFY